MRAFMRSESSSRCPYLWLVQAAIGHAVGTGGERSASLVERRAVARGREAVEVVVGVALCAVKAAQLQRGG